ncbi:MAG: hypothetical protein ACRENE_13365 [Polyangiaceae bacterium]
MHRRVAILGALAFLSGAMVAALPACSSSSSGSGAVDGGGGTDSAGSSSSGGVSSGGSSSGGASSSSGAGSSSSGSSGVTSSGSSSGSTGGDTMLITGRQRMSGLTMVGSNLYWVESGRGIFNVPANGDIATAVYLNAYLGAALGTDGTRLFFTQLKSGANEVDSVATDGTGEQVLATGTFNLGAIESSGPQIFVVNGTAYVNGVANILAIPAGDGGAPTAVVSPAPSSVEALLWVDSSGIYFTDTGGNVYWVALAGGAATKIFTNTVSGYGGPPPGDLAIVGGAAYFLVLGSGLQAIDLMTSTGGATATKVASYTMENGNASGVAPDGKGGLYELVGGSVPGIYGASLTAGTQTAVDTTDTGLANLAGAMHAVDSNHIYFVESGIGNFSIWSH